MVRLGNSDKYQIMQPEPNKRPDFSIKEKKRDGKKESFPVFVCVECNKVFQEGSSGLHELHLSSFSPWAWYKRRTCKGCKRVAKNKEKEKIKAQQSWLK